MTSLRRTGDCACALLTRTFALSLLLRAEPQSGPNSHSHGTLGGIPIHGPDGIGAAQKCWNFMRALFAACWLLLLLAPMQA